MGKYHGASFRRPVFSPNPPVSPAASDILESGISSLPDLIHFNAYKNPHHIFALQSELNAATHTENGEDGYVVSQITFEQLYKMVQACASWIRKAALLISARLSSQSVLHLLKKTDAGTILVSRRTAVPLTEYINTSARVVQVEPYTVFMACNYPVDEARETFRHGSQRRNNGNRNALILHSSGTTGLPKPIFLTHRYLLGYAACHEFPEDEEIDWVNLSTLPILSIGMTVCFPPSSTIPATKSTLDLIRTFNCRSLMTVPSIMDDIIYQPDEHERNEAFSLLAKLEFLAVGGGALNQEHGIILAKHDIKLLNHYGVTELGAIAPIFRPKSDYNWRFLRLRSDLSLELRPISNSAHFRLVGHPIGWDEPFEVQDELERNSASGRMEIRILGRTDDVIVLKTGEKIQPRQLEDALNAESTIRTAVCVGSGFFELAVLIDPMNEDANDESTKDQAWKLLSAINPSVDYHARIMSRSAIIIKPKGKSIPRSDKGSIMRQAVHEIFKEEIKNAYATMEVDSLNEGILLDPANMEMGIRHLITVVTSNRLNGNRMSKEEDLFDSGMDSLQTVHLSRLLGVGLRRLGQKNGRGTLQISADFIYRNPSIKSLAAESMHLIKKDGETKNDEETDRAKRMRTLVDEFVPSSGRQVALPLIEHTILMTGSTGNLGAHTLAKLTHIRTISKIICLVRGQQVTDSGTSTSSVKETESILLCRQRSALEAAGISLGPKEWAKVELLELTSIMEESEKREAQLSYLRGRVTHIIHLAWPMDFQRRLESFRPHIKLLQTLVELAEHSFVERKVKEPVRLLFSSSIAVARYYGPKEKGRDGPFGSIVPESAIQDPLVSMPVGYAEAKWICETYLHHTAKTSLGIEPVVVRVGQLSGPEKTTGIWKAEEHIPRMVRASQKIGAFPELKGWLQRVTMAGELRSLESFYKNHFHALAGGTVTLDTRKSRVLSNSLMRSGGVQSELIIEYIRRWQCDGLLT
ncbi:hypothetical protein F4859DRAFT_528306 [Xylaria cf. heliscus]|nr:hypothetical protein F4859DRAFT_528306 [Xylaria cf. heliscus]